MDDFRKKFFDALIEAERERQRAEHLVFIVMPVVKDNKLLVRALESVNRALVLVISTILKYEYLYKRIELSKDNKKNLEVFFKKCAIRYGLNEPDKEVIKKIIELGKRHKESGFEFSKVGKVVILDDDLSVEEVSLDKIKGFLALLRKVIEGAKSGFKAF